MWFKFTKLLPKLSFDREALKHRLTNKSLKFDLNFRRLKIYSRLFLIVLLVLFLLGYEPVLGFPPIRKAVVQAQAKQEIVQTINANSLPNIQLPHPGYLSTRYSSYHPGVDIATGLGMPIHPILDGVVEDVLLGFWGYGNHVIIRHQEGFSSLYGHMDKVYVKKGQTVTTQDTLGTVGMTGFTSGPHTHLEITKEGHTIDPVAILPKMQDYPSSEFLTPYQANKQPSPASTAANVKLPIQ